MTISSPPLNPHASTMLDRMLRLFVAHSVFTCSVVHLTNPTAITTATTHESRLESKSAIIYGLAPVAKYFICNQDEVSLGPLMSLLRDKVELKATVVEEGIPFNRDHGTHAFEYPGKDPKFNKVFNKAMINHTTIVINKILQCSSYKGFGQLNLNHKKLVDVGGGLGVTLSIITPNTTHIKAINFDLPHVIQHAPPYPGVEHVAADMFESVPKGDAIFMKWILHDWIDNHCLKLLKNFDAAHTALPDNRKVIVVEGMIPVMPDTSTAAKSMCQIDLVMMTQIPGGKELTQNEFLALAIGAGFTGISLECFICNFWVMEFYK